MNQVIEPEFKHQAIGSVEVRMNRKELNNKLVASVQVPANFERYPVILKAAVNQQGQRPEGLEAVVRPNEEDQLISKGKAVFDKCMKVVTKMGFPEEQGSQLCQLLTESMLLVDQEQQESNSPGNPAGNSTDTRPPPSGQIASDNCAKTAALDKEIAKLDAIIQRQEEELKPHRERQAKIASLEKQVHRLGLDSYLRNQINDESRIHYQALKFASKGFNVDDLKEIYESIPPRIKTASVNKQIPKSKVRLRTASTDESNNDISRFNIRETNSKLANSYLGLDNNLYDDYIA